MTGEVALPIHCPWCFRNKQNLDWLVCGIGRVDTHSQSVFGTEKLFQEPVQLAACVTECSGPNQNLKFYRGNAKKTSSIRQNSPKSSHHLPTTPPPSPASRQPSSVYPTAPYHPLVTPLNPDLAPLNLALPRTNQMNTGMKRQRG